MLTFSYGVLQTLINVLLAFDAYFSWFYALVESVPLFCPYEQREDRALDNMQKAIVMMEQFERVTINNHKSFLPHLAVFKVRTACSAPIFLPLSAPGCPHPLSTLAHTLASRPPVGSGVELLK